MFTREEDKRMRLNIPENITIEDLGKLPELSCVKDLLFTHLDDEKRKSRLSDYGIHMGGLMEALNFTAEAATKDDFILPLYTEEEIQKDQRLAEVRLLNFAFHPGAPVCIVCPGGGYNREWVLVEGYPMAQALSDSGINAFILIYRAGYYGLFPHPLDDLAKAVLWLTQNQERLSIDMNSYSVMGASAGGHLCAMWGTEKAGSRHYDLPSPAALLLMYPAANLSLFYNEWEIQEKAGREKEAGESAVFLKRIGGESFTRQDIERYSLDCLIDDHYPPTFIVHAEDDPVVPVENSHLTESLLRSRGIPVQVHFADKAGHSFGLGSGTDAEGWIKKAIEFYMDIKNGHIR